MNTAIRLCALLIALPLFAEPHRHGENCTGHSHEHTPPPQHNHDHDHDTTHDHNHDHDTIPCNGDHNHDHAHNHDHDATPYNEEHDHEHAHDHTAQTPACTGDHDHDHDHDAELESIHVPEELLHVIGLETTTTQKKQLQSTLTLHGRFEINPDAQSTAIAPIAGRLTLKKKTLDRIQPNDLLFTITSPDLQTRAAEITLLQQRLATFKASKIANAELEMQLKMKQSEWQALVGDATITNGVLSVYATIEGYIDTRLVNDGAWVEMGDPILNLLHDNNLRFKALLPSADTHHLTSGMHATHSNHHGTLRLGTTTESGLTPVYVILDHHDQHTRLGAYATMECVTASTEHPQWVVPKKAIVRLGLQPTVFVKDKTRPGTFIAQPITPLLTKGEWVAVKGLPDTNVDIVTAGQYELKIALESKKKGDKPIGHFHADGTFHTEAH